MMHMAKREARPPLWSDALWTTWTACLSMDVEKRPTFPSIAQQLGVSPHGLLAWVGVGGCGWVGVGVGGCGCTCERVYVYVGV